MPQKILGLPTPLTMTTALKSRISKALHLGLYTIAKIAWWTLNPDQFHAWYQPMKLNHHHTPPPKTNGMMSLKSSNDLMTSYERLRKNI